MKMLLSLIVGLVFGIAVESGYNVTNKPVKVEIQEVVKLVPTEVIVDRNITVYVDKIVKVKPKSITCTPVVEY